MASSSPSTTSPTLAVPGHPHRRPSPLPSCYSPLAASSSPAVSSISASAAPKHKPRGLGLRCRAAEEGPAPARGEAPPKVMISGAPASGKGTQCQRIVEKYGLVHISTGDLLRAEVSSGTEIGKTAKEYMDSGKLVPDQVVTDMVVSRLSQPDVQERGWLLDGYPRSFSQAQSLESMKIRPDIFIVLEVPDDILIDRCVGRRLDPVTGKIYHVKNFPPENEEISARLITRSDDTFEKVKSRLETYKQNSEAILPTYSDLLNQIDGNRPAEVVFQEIDSLLQKTCGSTSANKLTKTNGKPPDSLDTSSKNEWRGIPTRLNNIPHSREIRQYFYDDVVQATKRAVEDKKTRLQININIPELNPEMDVYRIGTLMELVRELSLSFADDGKCVKVCVQGSMGQGAFAGIPLQLAGTRKILEFMDWGDYGAKGTFINIGAVGASEVDKEDDMFILIAPQNAVGNCIIDDMRAMTDAAGDRPVILVNPRLKDMPGSSGVMQTMGRDMRLKYAASFETCYSFRLLFYAGSFYPIMGALRMAYPNKYEIYRRVDEPNGKEKYVFIAEFTENPTPDDITGAFKGPKKEKEKASSGFWGFLSGIL
ncbi:probable adenylate kinase 5, chloroplastic isoform X1 [Phragmites australis]|uniref:probable adenylate kinase 5, chloroplastic isoform X1 n=1 Tax=Phragmites australis TaxID=29695 RepID=UPI002D781196|nr:probable adenylate kinase 5, chloroplastic isoform X1 [Phragmites australis]XP_062194930.1 probable adenylate kinase 5, chloroplastic isoform X1 [Phragmites australis]XP_062194931.1 probable adenylate kinase 5, chloroplastic isoform X1 [Phragmites australis]